MDKKMTSEINPLIEGPSFTIAYDCLGEEYLFIGKVCVPAPDEMEHAIMWKDLAQQLLEERVVVPIRHELNRTGSGFEGILKGMDEMRQGKVSGTKLVYTI